MQDEREFLRPLVTGWHTAVKSGLRAKRGFMTIANQCRAFFSSSSGFMWKKDFMTQMGVDKAPKLQMTFAKAFELVALVGPTLYWKNPQRRVQPRRALEITPDMFGDPNDPNAQPIIQQMMGQLQQEASGDKIACQLMEHWLNFTPDEQSNGALSAHAMLSITDALVTGRGCLWAETVTQTGTGNKITGHYWDSVDNLIIDPDAETIYDAKWIAKRCTEPTWQVERDRNLPRGILKDKGTDISSENLGSLDRDPMAQLRELDENRMGSLNKSRSFDNITYFKIWSRCGVGSRLKGVSQDDILDHLDDMLGDCAYLEIAEGVDWPLNAYRPDMEQMDDQQIQQALEWPVPYCADDRWPVSVLDFYPKPRSVWPIAPLAPGLGELTFLNVMISHMASRIRQSTRDFVAVLQSAMDDVEDVLKSGEDLTVIKIKEVHKDIHSVIQFLQHPPTNLDAWKIIEAVTEIFERRVGLTELLYGLNAGNIQSRSAADANSKHDFVSIRPQHMANQVETWMSECAIKEKICARWHIGPNDVMPLLGGPGAYLWQMHIASADPTRVVHGMDATVEAGSARRPNKERDQSNMQQVMQVLMPIVGQLAQQGGNFGPINELLHEWGDSIDQDLTKIQLGPSAPDPNQQQIQQQQQQLNLAQLSADVDLTHAKTMAEQVKAQPPMPPPPPEPQENPLLKQAITSQAQMAHEAQKLQMDRQAMMAKLSQGAVEHQQKLTQREQEFKQKMLFSTLGQFMHPTGTHNVQ
jgi:hypothetical protein